MWKVMVVGFTLFIISLSVLNVYASNVSGIIVGNVSSNTINMIGFKNVSPIRNCKFYRGCDNCMKLLGNDTGFILLVRDSTPVAVVYSGANVSKITYASPLSSIIPVVKGNNVTFVSKTQYQNFLICLETSNKCKYRGGFYTTSLMLILLGTLVLTGVAYYYNRKEGA